MGTDESYKILPEMVRADALDFFADLVTEHGGDPQSLLRSAGLPEEILDRPQLHFPYRKLAALLAEAASALQRPDFGLLLAKRQAPCRIIGPMAIAMFNSETISDAFQYCADHTYTFSLSTDFGVIKDTRQPAWYLRFEITEPNMPDPRQIIEHALYSTHLLLVHISKGKVREKTVYFSHGPLSSPELYQSYFSDIALVFDHHYNGLEMDWACEKYPIVDRDRELYELATSFIDTRYAKPGEPLHVRVRAALRARSKVAEILVSDIAKTVAMHPRTFQRRLRSEGFRFDAIRDEVCRESALEYIQQTQLPLGRIADLLGFSDLSTFSRSCRRWFSSSPRRLRHSLH